MDPDKTVNDELEVNDSYDENFTENEEGNSETEVEAEQDYSDGNDTITLSRAELDQRIKDARKEQDGRWKDRIKGLEGKDGGKENRSEGDSKEEVTSDDKYTRLELKTEGIKDKAQQDEVLKYMRNEGIANVEDALKSDYVRFKLEQVTKNQERSRATQSPINRTGKPREKTGQELAKEAEAGNIPKTAFERKAALKALQERYNQT